MYQTVFSILENKYAINVKWKFIHGSGLLGVTLDQGEGNIRGLAKYLRQRYRPEDSWESVAALCFRFCTIHFQRGVEEVLREVQSRGPDSLFNLLMSILRCQTAEDYFNLCDSITGSKCFQNVSPLVEEVLQSLTPILEHVPQLTAWVTHKRHSWIAAGFCQAASSIPLEDWDLIPNHTNTVEILHQASYEWTGRYVPILDVIDG